MKKRMSILLGLAAVIALPSEAQRRDSLASHSVDIVTEERMNKGLVTNSLDALSGQAAGVNVSNSGADRMAMLSSVRVRGTTSITGGNDPLVIIDGVYSDLETLSTVYPADIESFSILKNAAETAQYGSRGASGVIEVKTKKGRGDAFHISYDGNIGFESVYKNIGMLRRNDYLTTAQRLGLDYNDGGFDTDFPNAITRMGVTTNHHVSFNGGAEQSNYRASLAWQHHNTIIKTKDQHNFVAKFDLHQQAFDRHVDINLGAFGSSAGNEYIFDVQKLFYSAAAQNPTFPAGMDGNGNWNKNSTASQINPPHALLHEKNDEKNLNFNTHLELAFHLYNKVSARRKQSLDLTLFGSYSYNSTENAQFCPTWVWGQGQAVRGEHKSQDWLGNARLDYHLTADIHALDITLLGEYQKSDRSGFWTLVKGFTTNELGYDNLGAGSIRPYGGTGSDYEDPSLASLMSSVNYRLMNRYTLALSARADGSSMFGDNHKWGFFPSVSLNWDAKQEAFLKNIKAISKLDFRIGYGLSGNLGGIDSYNSLLLLQANGIVNYNGSPTVTMVSMRNANPDLKWETRSNFNIGTDLGLWSNHLVLSAEYYYSRTRDMLYQYDVPVPPFPYPKLLANLGSMSNSGFELGLGTTPIARKDMELNINVNLSFQKNKLISLSGDLNGTTMTASSITSIGSLNGAGFHGGDNNVVYQIVGQPLGVFYLPHCTGLAKNSDGSYRYEIADIDESGDVNIEDGGDRYVAGQATPKMTLGSNISFRFRDFDISLQMNGAFGHKIYNGTALTYMNMSSFPDYNVMTGAPERNIKDQTATDYWLEKGDYLNFDYLTIGWNVPLKHRKYISALRISCSVNNFATITGYSGLTPMINSYVVSNTLGIDDKRSYPPSRTYSMSVSIQF